MPTDEAVAPRGDAVATDEAVASDAGKSFEALYQELAGKVAAGEAGSRTVELVRSGVHTIGKKVVEEAAEVWMAAEHESADRAAEEISQLVYHLQVMMLARGISLADVYAHL